MLAIQGVWRGTEISNPSVAVVPTGWALLDRELPGGGWPSQSLVEILAPQPAILEWRLLGPALRQVSERGGQVIVVGPPRQPYLPGLQQGGLDERRFVWIQAQTPAERLWATEQLVRANACGAIIAWLPQARPEHIRRLQVCAQSCQGLVFLCRPEAVRVEPSAAPLRVWAGLRPDWALDLHILKRRGPPHARPIALPSVPGALASVLSPRQLHPGQLPGQLFSREVPAHAVGRPVIALRPRRNPTLQ